MIPARPLQFRCNATTANLVSSHLHPVLWWLQENRLDLWIARDELDLGMMPTEEREDTPTRKI